MKGDITIRRSDVKPNEGTIVFKEINGELYQDDKVVFTPPSGHKATFSLSDIEIEGYEFSHSETIDGIECSTYNLIKP